MALYQTIGALPISTYHPPFTYQPERRSGAPMAEGHYRALLRPEAGGAKRRLPAIYGDLITNRISDTLGTANPMWFALMRELPCTVKTLNSSGVIPTPAGNAGTASAGDNTNGNID